MPEAKEIALKILKEHKVSPPVDGSVVKKGDEIIKDFEKAHRD